MASHKIFTSRAGFTLIEMLIVIGIIAMLIWMALFFDLNAYRGDAFRAERDTLVIALQKARADALNNINQAPHGVAVYPGGEAEYVVFQGGTWDSRESDLDKEFISSYPVEFEAGSLSEVVFAQLSGNVASEGDIIMKDPIRGMTMTISINHEGAIRW